MLKNLKASVLIFTMLNRTIITEQTTLGTSVKLEVKLCAILLVGKRHKSHTHRSDKFYFLNQVQFNSQ